MWNAASTRTARFACSALVVLACLTATSSVAGATKPPSNPSGLRASAAATSISLTWKSSTSRIGLAGYRTYVNGVHVGSAQTTSYTFSDLACGTGYRLGVDAYDTAGNASRMSSVSASTSACPPPAGDTSPPTAPALLTQTAAGETTVSLSWAASLDDVGVAGYGVYLAGGRAGSTQTTDYTVGGLVCGASYDLGVDAYDAAGNVSQRATVSASTSSCPPPRDTSPPTAPTLLTKTAADASSVTLSWSPSLDNVGVAGYGVYLNGSLSASSTWTSYTVGGLTCGTTYTVAVDAVDAAGNRSAQAALSVATAACPTSWRRVFFDDFLTFDATKWGTYYGQPGGDPGGWWESSHVVVSNGLLELQTYQDPKFDNRWVSGGVSNSKALKQTYGKYEVRFRMDGGKGVSNVLLLWPVADHWPPEIDFGEDGGTTNARSSMSATLHYGTTNRQIQKSVSADFTQWHTLGVEWTPGKLVYTLDGQPWASVTDANVPSEPMEMDMQTQAGTCGDQWAPCPDSTTPSHVDMQVDWVAAYAYVP
jgi:beta-glucanase (GH16 family)